MPFHRFKDATYGILPGDTYAAGSGTIGGVPYDRANVTDEGDGTPADGSAQADVAKVGVPNAGTYWVAFGEHATSLHTNRGFRAGTENTDALDDILRENIPIFMESVNDVSSGISFYDLSGGVDVFVGDTGAPVGAGNAFRYATVVDVNGDAIYNGYTRVVVTDIQPNGGGGSVVGAATPPSLGGYETDARFTFSPAIPAGTSFNILFGSRRSYARMMEEAYKHELNENKVQERNLQAGIGHVRYRGLDDAYRRSTKVPGGTSGTALAILVNGDTPGDGATITRDGQAIRMVSINQSQLGVNQQAATVPDPFMAMFHAEAAEYASSIYDNEKGGDIGLLYLTAIRHEIGGEANELSSEAEPLGALMVYNPVDIQGSTIGGDTPYTRVSKGAAATLNVGGLNPDGITITAPEYFRDSGNTALMLRRDVLLVTFPVNGSQQAFIPTNFVSDTEVNVVMLGGGSPTFNADQAVTIQWLQLNVSIGGSGTSAQLSISPFGWIAPAPLSVDTPSALDPPMFIQRRGTERCLEWGHHDPTGNLQIRGRLYGSGEVESLEGVIEGAWRSRDLSAAVAVTPYEINVKPWEFDVGATRSGYEQYMLRCSAGAAVIDINAITSGLEAGQRVIVVIENEDGTALTVNWDANFVFSGSDGDGPQSTGDVFKWEGVAVLTSAGNRYLMTRTDYSI